MGSINMGSNCYYYSYALPGFWETYVDAYLNLLVLM